MLFSQQSADEQQAVPFPCVPYLTKSSFINSSVDRVTWSPLLPPAALNPDLSNGPYNQRTKFGFQPFANDSRSGLTFLQLLPSRISSLFPLQRRPHVFFPSEERKEQASREHLHLLRAGAAGGGQGCSGHLFSEGLQLHLCWQRSEMLGGRKKGEKPTLPLLLENKKERNSGRASPELLRIQGRKFCQIKCIQSQNILKKTSLNSRLSS